jgi:hypothetical protein
MTEWKPSKRQEDFLSLPFSIFEALYGGAAGGGKSEVLLVYPIVTELFRHPKFKGLLMRRTYSELEKSLIIRSEEFYRGSGATYNKQLRRWTWPWGAIVDFGHAEYEKDVRKYDTTEYNYIGLDEGTSFTEFQILYMISRCRSSVVDLPSLLRIATNPGNVGHGFVRRRYVEPAIDGYKIIVDPVSKIKRIFIPSKATDNPYLMKADPEYVERLKMLPIAERKAKLDGDWWTFVGQVFDDFRLNRLPDEPDNAVHVIDPFPIPEWWPRILAVDWGFQAMTWAGFGAISPNGRVYIYKEYTGYREKVSTWATNIGHMALNENLVEVIMDSNAWDKRGEEKSVAEQFKEYSGLSPRPAEKGKGSRISGKMLMQEFIRWRPRPMRSYDPGTYDQEMADAILRKQGTEAYGKYLASFQPEKPETNLPRLQIFSNCTALINAIPLCVYASSDSDGIPSEDVAEFNGDDPYDGCRYLLRAVDSYVNSARSESEKREKISKVLEKFDATKDQTFLHRALSVLDKQKGSYGTRRSSRRGYYSAAR